MTNLPLGLRTNLVSTSHLAGRAYLITNFSKSYLIASFETLSLCWHEMRIVSILNGVIIDPFF